MLCFKKNIIFKVPLGGAKPLVAHGLRGNESVNDGNAIHARYMLVLESIVYIPTFVKMFLCNLEENIYSVYVCVFSKGL